MRKRIRRKNTTVIKPKKRHLEPADLEDTFDTPELEDWMVAGGK